MISRDIEESFCPSMISQESLPPVVLGSEEGGWGVGLVLRSLSGFWERLAHTWNARGNIELEQKIGTLGGGWPERRVGLRCAQRRFPGVPVWQVHKEEGPGWEKGSEGHAE